VFDSEAPRGRIGLILPAFANKSAIPARPAPHAALGVDLDYTRVSNLTVP
jgi:hypothetical protein